MEDQTKVVPVLKVKLKYYVFGLCYGILAILFTCISYAHFSSKIGDVFKDGVLKKRGRVVEYWDNCTEENTPYMMTITHTISTLTPLKWIWRFGIASSIPYFGVIMPVCNFKMFYNHEFLKTSKLSTKQVRILSYLAGIGSFIEFLAVMVICFCLDVYYNDEEHTKKPDGSPITVLDAPTPTWHWLFHIKAFITMIFAQVITAMIILVLLFSQKSERMKMKHGLTQKLILMSVVCTSGLATFAFLNLDYSLCQDQLGVYFSVFEYIFVTTSFLLYTEYTRFYWDKSVVLSLHALPDSIEGQTVYDQVPSDKSENIVCEEKTRILSENAISS